MPSQTLLRQSCAATFLIFVEKNKENEEVTKRVKHQFRRKNVELNERKKETCEQILLLFNSKKTKETKKKSAKKCYLQEL